MTPRDRARALLVSVLDPVELRDRDGGVDVRTRSAGELADAVMVLFPEVEERLYGTACEGTVMFPAALGEATHARLVLSTATEEISHG